jgi:hypothetical protein
MLCYKFSNVASKKRVNPLLELRRQLGCPPKLLSAERLGQLTGCSAGTLRNVESGFRSFSSELQKHLRSRGVEWDQASGEWYFTFDRDAQLSVYLLESLRRLTRGDARSQNDDRECLCKRLTALLEHVSDSAYTDLRLDLDRSLEELLERYQIEGAKPVFQQTALKIKMEKNPSGSDHLIKSRSGPMGTIDVSELGYQEQASELVKNDAA